MCLAPEALPHGRQILQRCADLQTSITDMGGRDLSQLRVKTRQMTDVSGFLSAKGQLAGLLDPAQQLVISGSRNTRRRKRVNPLGKGDAPGPVTGWHKSSSERRVLTTRLALFV